MIPKMELISSVVQPSEAILTQGSQGIIKALSFVQAWFESNGIREETSASEIISRLKPLISLFGYTPHNGPVFRVFPFPENLVDKAQVGKIYKVKTANSPVQSWSATLKAAIKFSKSPSYVDFDNDNTAICELVSPGKELLNVDWLVDVLKSILARFKKYRDIDADVGYVYQYALDLYDVLKSSFIQEEEVIMLLPTLSQVKLIQLTKP